MRWVVDGPNAVENTQQPEHSGVCRVPRDFHYEALIVLGQIGEPIVKGDGTLSRTSPRRAGPEAMTDIGNGRVEHNSLNRAGEVIGVHSDIVALGIPNRPFLPPIGLGLRRPHGVLLRVARPVNDGRVTALRMRVLISMLSVILCFGVAGCEPDNDVYIQNQTDQKLYFVIIGDDGSWNERAPLYPQKTTTVGVLGSGCASGQFLVADGGRNVIKRFDQVCWHGTYSVP